MFVWQYVVSYSDETVDTPTPNPAGNLINLNNYGG